MLSNLGGNGGKCIEKCNFYVKYFDKIKCCASQPYLVFFRAETWNTHIFFLWPNLIRAETRSTHILFLQKQNFLTIKSQCVCVILIMCMQYLFQRANRTPTPTPTPTHPKQTKKKTHYLSVCLCDIPIFRVDRNVLWILDELPPPSNPHKKKKKKKTLLHMP